MVRVMWRQVVFMVKSGDEFDIEIPWVVCCLIVCSRAILNFRAGYDSDVNRGDVAPGNAYSVPIWGLCIWSIMWLRRLFNGWVKFAFIYYGYAEFANNGYKVFFLFFR